MRASHEPRLVEAGFQPAGHGGILPPGWEAGLTGSQGWLPPRGVRARRGFTMIEIAICIAVIGFALVAVIGVLPKGMLTQRDNRADTIIGQDGMYWMEAITRSGTNGVDELTNFVDEIRVGGTTYTFNNGFRNGYDIIGLLCTDAPGTRVVVRAISGSAVERAGLARDLAFKYALYVDIQPSKTALLGGINDLDSVSEVVLTFRWPITRTGEGGRSRVFREQVSGTRQEIDSRHFFLKP